MTDSEHDEEDDSNFIDDFRETKVPKLLRSRGHCIFAPNKKLALLAPEPSSPEPFKFNLEVAATPGLVGIIRKRSAAVDLKDSTPAKIDRRVGWADENGDEYSLAIVKEFSAEPDSLRYDASIEDADSASSADEDEFTLDFLDQDVAKEAEEVREEEDSWDHPEQCEDVMGDNEYDQEHDDLGLMIDEPIKEEEVKEVDVVQVGKKANKKRKRNQNNQSLERHRLRKFVPSEKSAATKEKLDNFFDLAKGPVVLPNWLSMLAERGPDPNDRHPIPAPWLEDPSKQWMSDYLTVSDERRAREKSEASDMPDNLEEFAAAAAVKAEPVDMEFADSATIVEPKESVVKIEEVEIKKEVEEEAVEMMHQEDLREVEMKKEQEDEMEMNLEPLLSPPPAENNGEIEVIAEKPSKGKGRGKKTPETKSKAKQPTRTMKQLTMRERYEARQERKRHAAEAALHKIQDKEEVVIDDESDPINSCSESDADACEEEVVEIKRRKTRERKKEEREHERQRKREEKALKKAMREEAQRRRKEKQNKVDDEVPGKRGRGRPRKVKQEEDAEVQIIETPKNRAAARRASRALLATAPREDGGELDSTPIPVCELSEDDGEEDTPRRRGRKRARRIHGVNGMWSEPKKETLDSDEDENTAKRINTGIYIRNPCLQHDIEELYISDGAAVDDEVDVRAKDPFLTLSSESCFRHDEEAEMRGPGTMGPDNFDPDEEVQQRLSEVLKHNKEQSVRLEEATEGVGKKKDAFKANTIRKFEPYVVHGVQNSSSCTTWPARGLPAVGREFPQFESLYWKKHGGAQFNGLVRLRPPNHKGEMDISDRIQHLHEEATGYKFRPLTDRDLMKNLIQLVRSKRYGGKTQWSPLVPPVNPYLLPEKSTRRVKKEAPSATSLVEPEQPRMQTSPVSSESDISVVAVGYKITALSRPQLGNTEPVNTWQPPWDEMGEELPSMEDDPFFGEPLLEEERVARESAAAEAASRAASTEDLQQTQPDTTIGAAYSFVANCM